MDNDHIKTVIDLSSQLNMTLRLALAAYDQTVLMKRALALLAQATPLDAQQTVAFTALLQDVQGSEQESTHVLRLMMSRHRELAARPGDGQAELS